MEILFNCRFIDFDHFKMEKCPYMCGNTSNLEWELEKRKEIIEGLKKSNKPTLQRIYEKYNKQKLLDDLNLN